MVDSSSQSDFANFLSQHIHILFDEEGQFINLGLTKEGSEEFYYQIMYPAQGFVTHNITNLSNDDFEAVEKFTQNENLPEFMSEDKGNGEGYFQFNVESGASVEKNSIIAEKLLYDIHNIKDINDISIEIVGVSEDKVSVERSSPTDESQSLSKQMKINCNITVYPDPPEGVLNEIMGGESSIATKKEVVEHSKLLGSGHKELIYEYSPNQNLLINNSGISVDSEIRDIQIGYTSILDAELMKDKDLKTKSSAYVLHDTDYIRLTVGNYSCPFCQEYTGLYDSVRDHISSVDDGTHTQDEKRDIEIESIFYIYLIGRAEKFSYTGSRFDGDDKFTIENQPSVTSSELERAIQIISENIEDRSENTFVLQDYIQRCGNLKVEGWQKSGATNISGGLSGGFDSSGKSKGVQVGPFIRSKSKTEGSISAEFDGAISDDSFVSEIDFLQISEDGIFVDSDPVLNFNYQEIDRILSRDEGFSIEVGDTTYSIFGPASYVGLALGKEGDYNEISSEHTNRALTLAQQRMDETSKQSNGSEDRESDSASKLREIKNLYEDGILTEEEFESKKEEILDDY